MNMRPILSAFVSGVLLLSTTGMALAHPTVTSQAVALESSVAAPAIEWILGAAEAGLSTTDDVTVYATSMQDDEELEAALEELEEILEELIEALEELEAALDE